MNVCMSCVLNERRARARTRTHTFDGSSHYRHTCVHHLLYKRALFRTVSFFFSFKCNIQRKFVYQRASVWQRLITQLGKIVPTRAAFHHDEVTLVLLVLNSLSNYTYIQSHDHHIITCCGLVLYEQRLICFVFFLFFFRSTFCGLCYISVEFALFRFCSWFSFVFTFFFSRK